MKPGIKTALIFGVSGQDGAYLASLLLEQGLSVHGTSRDCEVTSFTNLHYLGIEKRIRLHSCTITDFRSVFQVINDVKPAYIFNLSAQSSVSLSFGQPVETLQSSTIGTLNILEAIRLLQLDTRFYNASSGECFGNTVDGPADESYPFRPRSPYGVGKAAAHWAVANYRESYNLFACSGILFNHESPLRPARFVTQKIIRGAVDIAEKKSKTLELGNLNVQRDWGWAPEYVDAMWRMLNVDKPEDFIIATGEANSLASFVEFTFDYCGLRWSDHVTIDKRFFRPSDITISVGNAQKAHQILGWRAKTLMRDIIIKLLDSEFARRRESHRPANNTLSDTRALNN